MTRGFSFGATPRAILRFTTSWLSCQQMNVNQTYLVGAIILLPLRLSRRGVQKLYKVELRICCLRISQLKHKILLLPLLCLSFSVFLLNSQSYMLAMQTQPSRFIIMDITRRALYNSLRMNWVLDPTLEVEPWQVEDYRSMPVDQLFERLEDRGFPLDKPNFISFSDSVDTPEDLTDLLLADAQFDAKDHDQTYLIVFELWRRLLPEKPCLSVFCDELDHQIHLYDRGHAGKAEDIQDVLANMQVILDENTDEGADPHEAFDYIDSATANDVESFLYDFISEQIDNENYAYASDLLDGFSSYVNDVKWFKFLRARLTLNAEEANRMIKRLVEDKQTQPDLSFNLEVLSSLVRVGDKDTFERLARKTAEMLSVEEDFQNIISICADFYHRLDKEKTEQTLQMMLNQREMNDLEAPFDKKDPQFAEFLKIIG